MPKFACGFCGSKIKVPDAYVGKRVKCPGCGKAVVVPGEVPDDVASGGLDLSLLDDTMSGGEETKGKPRKLRSIVIGCGVCSKTIHIPENRKGAVTPCPKCKTPLFVDVPELPDTAGSTIDFKHLVLDPASEPSLAGDSLAGGSMASRTGTLGGSRLGKTGRPGKSSRGATGTGLALGNTGSFSAGPAQTSQDQMQELRSLNDLKASGAISDDEYRKRKAAIYAGGGTSALARQAMSRSAAGASEQAIRVKTSGSIPGPIKVLVGVGVVALVGFLGWEYGVKPALNIGVSEPVAEAEEDPAAAEARRIAREQREAEERAAAKAAALAEAEAAAAVTWASLIPDLGPESLEVAIVEPGKPGPATDQSLFAMDDEEEMLEPTGEEPTVFAGGVGPAGSGDSVEAATPPQPEPREARPRRPGQPGKIAFWDIMYPQARDGHPLERESSFTYRFEQGDQSALIGVGIGPAVDDIAGGDFVRWQRLEILQKLTDGLDRRPGFEDARVPLPNDRTQTIEGFTFIETKIRGDRTRDGQRPYLTLLTGIQDGYAMHYWFEGPLSLERPWKREAVGKAIVE